MVKMKRDYDFGGIFGQSSKNHDKILTTKLRGREIIQNIRIIDF